MSGKLGDRSEEGREPELPVDPGLCSGCVHFEILRSKRSAFVFCARSRFDERFSRYPPLPVASCAGFEPASTEAQT